MSGSAIAYRKKSPGVKCECLEKAFTCVFPTETCVPKNSIGIYTPDEVFKCKRCVCFSEKLLFLDSFPVYETFGLRCLGRVAQDAHIWGVCGRTPTRANEIEENWFLLCYKSEKRFIAQAILHIEGSTISLNVDRDAITEFLNAMKNEMTTFSLLKMENKHLKRAHPKEKPRKNSTAKMKKLKETSFSETFASAVVEDKEESDLFSGEEDSASKEIDLSFSSASPSLEGVKEEKIELPSQQEMDVVEVSDTDSVLTSSLISPDIDDFQERLDAAKFSKVPYDIFFDALGLPAPESTPFLEYDEELVSSPRVVPNTTCSETRQAEYTDLPFEWDFLESCN